MQPPEKVARPIAALCTEAAAPISGETFLIEHERIGLFQPLTITQHVECRPDWSASDLARAIAGLELHPLSDAYS